MSKPLRYIGQAVVYLGIAALLGIFSNAPAYVHFPPSQAAITLSLVHSAQRKEECRRLSAQEIAELAPNMRKALSCPRERLPLWLEVTLDGKVLFQESLPPTGLWSDGPARVYQRFTATPGRHSLALRMRDSARTEGFDYQFDSSIELTPQQALIIDFRPESGGFILR